MPESPTLGSPKRSALISALIHASAIVLVLFLSTSKHSPIAKLIPARDTAVYLPPVSRLPLSGAGGGGQHSPLPVPKGQPPKTAPRVFTMPVMIPRDTPPPLEMPPAVLAVSSLETPAIDLAHIGSLIGRSGPMSGGTGGGGGLGDGAGPGAGDKSGPGIGSDGAIGIGGLPRKNATKPELLSKEEPEYSEEARKSKLQGTVVLSIVVSATGGVSDLRVIRGLGLGLDERAMEAVKQWRFRPATVDGKPAATRAVVEVNFRLL
jgi:periplasmic protein TonB